MGFDELVKINVEDSSPLAGNHSSGDHRSPAGPHLSGNIESRSPRRLGGSEKGFGD